jgi:2-methylcitrate dehydratase PrpD
LNAEQTAHAIGIASSESAGTVENLPSAGKNVSVGNAARNGLFAALLAEQGYTAASLALEGPLGWARAMGDVPVVEEITGELGTRWEAGKNTYKPYPCGIVMHAVIDACLALRRDHGLQASDIADVAVSGEQLLLDRGDRVVTGERDARVSIHHCAAVSFLFGKAGLAEFEDATVHHPDVAAFRYRCMSVLDSGSPRGAATATVRTTDGRTLAATVLHAKGSLQQPLSDREIEDKVRDSARHGGFTGAVDDAIAAIWAVDAAPTITPLARLLGQ